jgi:acetyl esterase/lipase
MPSPLTIDPALFDPAAVSEETKALDVVLHQNTVNTPKWWEIGVQEFRRRRLAGETPRPAPVLIPTGEHFSIPSREEGRHFPSRLFRPQNGKAVRGVFMHIHGGGWVIGDEISQEERLQDMANDHGLVCISVGYRLAPEHPYPAGIEDGHDAVEWLVLNSQEKFQAPLAFIGGESAGAHLSMLCVLHLLNHKEDKFSSFKFKGLLLHFGCYDISWTPSATNMDKTYPGLTLDPEMMFHFRKAFLGDMPLEDMRKPELSPLYANLFPLWGKLPSALFTCGTMDCLIDDTLFMSAKWTAAGGDTVLEIVPGAQHGYIGAPRSTPGSGSEQGMAAVDKFITARI